MNDLDCPPGSPALGLLRNMAMQGTATAPLLQLGQQWADRYAPGSDPIRAAVMIACGVLIREAYDTQGPAYAKGIVALIASEAKEARDYIRRWEANDFEQATGMRPPAKRRTRA